MNKRDRSKFKKYISRYKKFIIFGHENPDPDSICSCIAMEYLLSSLKKDVLCINADPSPLNLIPLDYRNVINSIAEDALIPDDLENWGILILDTNDLNNIGSVYEKIVKEAFSYMIIDHHSHKMNTDNSHILNVSASSTCEIIYSLYETLKIKIPKEVGDALYAGILFDSGSFHYPKTSAYTFQAASTITKNGTDPNYLYLLLYEHESISSLRLLSSVLSTLELYHNDQIAFLTMNRNTLITSGAKYSESSYLINIPLRCHNVLVSVFYKENKDGTRRISFRSKGNIDVAEFCIKNDGGGHKNAAGFKVPDSLTSLDEIKENIISFLIKEITKNDH